MWKALLVDFGRRFLDAVGRVLLRRAKQAEVLKASGGGRKLATGKKKKVSR